MVNPYELIALANENELDIESFLFAWSLFLSKNGQENFNREFGIYYELNKNKHDYMAIIDKLEEKGYLTNGNSSNVYSFSKIVFTEKFKNILFIDVESAWQEVINTYPLTLVLNNNQVVSMQGTKHPDLEGYYFEKIIKGGNKKLHQEFIYLIGEYYKGKKRVDYGVGLEKCLFSWSSMKLTIREELETNNGTVNDIYFEV